jgi:hypothetical protein
LTSFKDDPIRDGRQVHCRFAPGRIRREVVGVGSGGHDREHGKTHHEPEESGDLARGVKRNRDEDPQWDSDQSRGD